MTRSRTLLDVLVLLSICYVLFFFRMGARDLWNPDEPRYAQVAREMLQSGEWIVPRLNGEVYPEKPPLYFWLVALVSKPFGDVTEITTRLPSALAAAIIVLLTYALGCKLLGRNVAVMGAMITATSAEFFVIGRSGVIDSLLTLCILATLIVFVIGYSERRPSLYVAGFLFLVPAALSKGPVGIAVPVLVMLSFLSVELLFRKDGAKKQLAWFAFATVVGLTIIAAFVVPWWLAAYKKSGGAYGSMSILMSQTGGRLFDSYSHRRPFYYYFGQILWQFMPWTVFLPLTIHTLRKRGDFRENLGLRFIVVWFLSVFLFFTLVSGKRSQYILPLLPAGGLILAWMLEKRDIHEGILGKRKEFSVPLLVLLVMSLTGMAVIMGAVHWYERTYFRTTAAAAFAITVVLVMLTRRLLTSPPRTALAGVLAATTIVVATAFGFVAPFVDRYKSARPFCDSVLAELDSNDALFFYTEYRPNIHYYMGRRMPRLDARKEVLDALDRSPRVLLVLNPGRTYLLSLDAGYEIEEITQARIGSRELVCLAIQSTNISP